MTKNKGKHISEAKETEDEFIIVDGVRMIGLGGIRISEAAFEHIFKGMAKDGDKGEQKIAQGSILGD